MLDAPLLQRRLHNNQMHRKLISFENHTVNLFNSQLIRLSLFSAMKNDLIFLKENDLIEEDNFNQHSDNVDYMIAQAAKFLTIFVGNLVIDGYVNNWTKGSL
jgi:hypothetical protein